MSSVFHTFTWRPLKWTECQEVARIPGNQSGRRQGQLLRTMSPGVVCTGGMGSSQPCKFGYVGPCTLQEAEVQRGEATGPGAHGFSVRARMTPRSLLRRLPAPARLVLRGYFGQRTALDLCSPETTAEGRETRQVKAQIWRRRCP